MIRSPVSTGDENDLAVRLSLLTGQAFFLGLTLGLLIVAAFALLISSYGSGALPWVYIAVAVAGSGAFYGFAEAQRRWSLVEVSITAELVVIAFLVTAWAGLLYAQASWLAFVAMVLFPLLIQIGFVIVGGQAGRLLDVRQIKRYFARIVAGFVIGFMVAGALAAPLQRVLGRTEYLLLAAAIAASVMLIMLLLTNLRYHATLAQAGDRGPRIQPPPLRAVLRKRFVLLIFGYQMLSAIATQLLEFMVMAAAAERFTGSDALASFYGTFTFALNLSDLLFLVLVAGLLLSRFGLKFGLTFNPAAVVLLLAGLVVIGFTLGPMAPQFFAVILLSRILDLTFTDGATRTSINAAYQALPPHERVTVQTGVEGIGVPVALGLTGVVLLLFTSLENVTLVHVAVFGLAVSLVWLLAAVLVYRDYAVNLLQSMRRRMLEPGALILEDDATLAVVNRLLSTGKLTDVRPALELLETADHPSLTQVLPALALSEAVAVQLEALARIERRKEQAALAATQELAQTAPSPRVQGAALRARCALEEADAVEAVLPFLDASQRDVRLGAAVGLLRYGSTPGILAVGERLPGWASSADADERCFLAQVIGETAQQHFYHPLLPLLADPDERVRRAALHAAGRVAHPRLLPGVMENLASSATRSTAADALVAYGDRILPLVENALTLPAAPPEHTARLVRLCRQLQGDALVALMVRHLQHPTDTVRDQVLAVLSACRYRPAPEEARTLDAALVNEVRQGHEILQAQQQIGEGATTATVQRALAEEAVRVRRRIFLLLSFLYDPESILRAESQLDMGTRAEQALAFELLDVTLSSAHKALAVPLIDPRLAQSQRLRLLARHFTIAEMTREERLQDLARHGAHAWTRACALHALAELGNSQTAPIAEDALRDEHPVVRETAAWCLYKLAPERFGRYTAILAADTDRLVAHLSAALSAGTAPRNGSG